MENKKQDSFPVLMFICVIAIGGVGLCLVANMNPLFYAAVSEALGLPRATFSLYYSVQCLFCMVALFFAGSIISKYKKLLPIFSAACYLVIGLGYLAFSRANSLTVFMICGAFMGIGVAFGGFLLVGTLINNWFFKKTGLIVGIYSACTSIVGAIISPRMAVLIASDWRAGYTAVAIGCFIMIPFCLCIKFSPELAGRKAWGADEVEQTEAKPVNNSGVTYNRALKSSTFYLCVLVVFLATAYANFTYAIPGHAANVGYDPATVGLVSSCYLISSIFGKLGGGWMKDRIGLVKALAVIVVLGVIGMLIMIFVPTIKGFMLAGSFLFGIAMSITGVFPPLVVRECFGNKAYSKILSNVTTMIYVSSMTVIPVYNLFYDRTGSYVFGMCVSMCALLLCLGSTATAIKTSKKLERE